ncbi:MAG: golgi-body localization protein domain-containing protein [Piptocephalis tieghemiana]|nr:MAG: golgi-body localization protein domain-containing protein [Piptocephalis tieghemiana]
MLWVLFKVVISLSVTYICLFHLINFLLIRKFGLRVGSVRFRSINDLSLCLPGPGGILEVGRIELKLGWPRWKNGRRRWWSVAISNVTMIPSKTTRSGSTPSMEIDDRSPSSKSSSGSRRTRKRKEEKRKSRKGNKERKDTSKGPMSKVQTLIDEWSTALYPGRRPEPVSWIKACVMDTAVWVISCGEITLSSLSIPLSPERPNGPQITLSRLIIRPCLLTSHMNDAKHLIWPFTIDMTLYSLNLFGLRKDRSVIQVPSLVFRLAGGLSGFKVIRKQSLLHGLQTEWRVDTLQVDVDELLHFLRGPLDTAPGTLPKWTSRYTVQLLKVIMQGFCFSAHVTDNGVSTGISFESLSLIGSQPGTSSDNRSKAIGLGASKLFLLSGPWMLSLISQALECLKPTLKTNSSHSSTDQEHIPSAPSSSITPSSTMDTIQSTLAIWIRSSTQITIRICDVDLQWFSTLLSESPDHSASLRLEEFYARTSSEEATELSGTERGNHRVILTRGRSRRGDPSLRGVVGKVKSTVLLYRSHLPMEEEGSWSDHEWAANLVDQAKREDIMRGKVGWKLSVEDVRLLEYMRASQQSQRKEKSRKSGKSSKHDKSTILEKSAGELLKIRSIEMTGLPIPDLPDGVRQSYLPKPRRGSFIAGAPEVMDEADSEDKDDHAHCMSPQAMRNEERRVRALGYPNIWDYQCSIPKVRLTASVHPVQSLLTGLLSLGTPSLYDVPKDEEDEMLIQALRESCPQIPSTSPSPSTAPFESEGGRVKKCLLLQVHRIKVVFQLVGEVPLQIKGEELLLHSGINRGLIKDPMDASSGASSPISGDNNFISMDRLLLRGRKPPSRKVPSVHSHGEGGKGSWVTIVDVDRLKTFHEGNRQRIQGYMLHANLPDRYSVADLLDGVNNSIKWIKSIIHEILHGEPKEHTHTHISLPFSILLELRIFTLEMEDDPFEARLSRIFLHGGAEQRERMMREEVMRKRLSQWDYLRESDVPFTPSQEPPVSGRSWEQGKLRGMDPSRAWSRLAEHNARSWQRIAQITMQRKDLPPFLQLKAPALQLYIGPTNFGLDGAPSFISRNDGGQSPVRDYAYDLLVVLRWVLRAQELSVRFRDIPHHLIYIPALQGLYPSAAFVWETDMVISEQAPGPQAFRSVAVPWEGSDKGGQGRVTMVHRTINPLKLHMDSRLRMYARLRPTTFTWGVCLQPILTEFAHKLDRITHPNPDPSPHLGVWDKLRLILHWRMRLNWVRFPDGDEAMEERYRGGNLGCLEKVNMDQDPEEDGGMDQGLDIRLPGGLNPYSEYRNDQGFVLQWRGIRQFTVGEDADWLLACHSSDFIVGVPKAPYKGPSYEESAWGRRHTDPDRVKVQFMHLTGDVHVRFGLKWYRKDGKIPIPHHLVSTRMPIPGESEEEHGDSFADFRTQILKSHYHFSSGESDISSLKGNAIRLTPPMIDRISRFFEQFGSEYTPPVRLGRLFPDVAKPSPKLGKAMDAHVFNFTFKPVMIGYLLHSTGVGSSDQEAHIERMMTGFKARIGEARLQLTNARQRRIMSNYALERAGEQGARKMLVWEQVIKRVTLDFADMEARMIVWSDGDGKVSMSRSRGGRRDSIGEASQLDDAQVWVEGADFEDLDVPSLETPFERIQQEVLISPFIQCPRATYITRPKGNQARPEVHRSSKDESIAGLEEEAMREVDNRALQIGYYRERHQEVDDAIRRLSAMYDAIGQVPDSIRHAITEGSLPSSSLYASSEETDTSTEERSFIDRPKSESFSDSRVDMTHMKAVLTIFREQRAALAERIDGIISGEIRVDLSESGMPMFSEDMTDEDEVGSTSSSSYCTGDTGRRGSHERAEELKEDEDEDEKEEEEERSIFIHNPLILWNTEVRNAVFRFMALYDRYRAVSYAVRSTALQVFRSFITSQERAKGTGTGGLETQNGLGEESDSIYASVDMEGGEDDSDGYTGGSDTVEGLIERILSPTPASNHESNQDPSFNLASRSTTFHSATSGSSSDRDHHLRAGDGAESGKREGTGGVPEAYSNATSNLPTNYRLLKRFSLQLVNPQVSFSVGSLIPRINRREKMSDGDEASEMEGRNGLEDGDVESETLGVEEDRVVLSSENFYLQYFSLIDPRYQGDDTNEKVKTKMLLRIQHLQLFSVMEQEVTSAGWWKRGLAPLNPEQERTHGCLRMPLELFLHQYQGESGPFKCMVEGAISTVSYDKYNRLRFIQGGDSDHSNPSSRASASTASGSQDPSNGGNQGSEGRVGEEGKGGSGGDTREEEDSSPYRTSQELDTVFIHIPRFLFTADPEQFALLLTLVNDLIIYHEPIRKLVLDQVKAVVVSSSALDVYDGVVETMEQLQGSARDLYEVVQEAEQEVRVPGGRERLEQVRRQYHQLMDYFYIATEAINRAQRIMQPGVNEASKSVTRGTRAIMTADEVSWIALQVSREPLCEFTLIGADLVWKMLEDKSSVNSLQVEELTCVNLSSPVSVPNDASVFKDIIFPYLHGPHASEKALAFANQKMLRVYWRELPPVGGIQVVEHFEVNIFPLTLQLTHEFGRKIMAYIFSERRRKKATEEGLEPLDVPDGGTNGEGERIGRGTKGSANSSATSSSSSHSISTSIPSSGEVRDKGKSTVEIQALAHSIGFGDESTPIQLMQARAAKNKTFLYIHVPGAPICLSYQGKKTKNFTDIRGFVFDFPTLKYQNKTWSWLDLTLQIKKDLYWSALSHTGSLMKEKLFHNSHHAPPVNASVNLPYLTAYTGEVMLHDKANANDMEDKGKRKRRPPAVVTRPHAGWHSLPRSSSGRLSHHLPRRDGNARALLARKRQSAFIEKMADLPSPNPLIPSSSSPPASPRAAVTRKGHGIERRRSKRRTIFGRLRNHKEGTRDHKKEQSSLMEAAGSSSHLHSTGGNPKGLSTQKEDVEGESSKMTEEEKRRILLGGAYGDPST